MLEIQEVKTVKNERPSNLEIANVIDVLAWYYDMLKRGDRDGWEYDPNYVFCVKHWLVNEVLK